MHLGDPLEAYSCAPSPASFPKSPGNEVDFAKDLICDLALSRDVQELNTITIET